MHDMKNGYSCWLRPRRWWVGQIRNGIGERGVHERQGRPWRDKVCCIIYKWENIPEKNLYSVVARVRPNRLIWRSLRESMQKKKYTDWWKRFFFHLDLRTLSSIQNMPGWNWNQTRSATLLLFPTRHVRINVSSPIPIDRRGRHSKTPPPLKTIGLIMDITTHQCTIWFYESAETRSGWARKWSRNTKKQLFFGKKMLTGKKHGAVCQIPSNDAGWLRTALQRWIVAWLSGGDCRVLRTEFRPS